MSNTAGWGKPPKAPEASSSAAGAAAATMDRDAGDSLLRFLSRLSAFGLAAGRDPLLKPVKRAS